MCKPGSEGDLGGQPPRSTRPMLPLGSGTNRPRGSSLEDDVGERQDKLSRLAAERHKAVVRVEGFRLVVLSIDHQGENGDLRSQGSLYSIPQQGAAELAPAIRLVHRQPTQSCYRNGWVTRQLLGKLCWHIGQRNTGRRKRVVAGDLRSRRFERDLACRRATANVLSCLLLEIPV